MGTEDGYWQGLEGAQPLGGTRWRVGRKLLEFGSEGKRMTRHAWEGGGRTGGGLRERNLSQCRQDRGNRAGV